MYTIKFSSDVGDVLEEGFDKENFDIFRKEAIRSKLMTQADLDTSNAKLLDS